MKLASTSILSKSSISRYQIGLHILFWTAYFIYESFIWGMVDGEYRQRLAFSLLELPIKIAAAYVTLYYLINKLLLPRKYTLFIIMLILSMFAFGITLRTMSYYAIYPSFYPEGLRLPVLYFPKILIGIFAIYSVVAIVASYHLANHWYNHQLAAQQLEKEKLESELKLLKSQINPHFLFNTLNNLYVLALNQSKRTPETVHKLSELMSYMLYEINQHEVPLKKELYYIENYIALEKLSYESRLDISLNIYSELNSIMIAPMMILPFVENCFKHGVSKQLTHSWIRIDISFSDNILTIKVENSKNPKAATTMRAVSGIGLQNVRKRLSLIYPDRHQLDIHDEEESYLVILKLNIPDQVLNTPKDADHLKHHTA